MPSHANTSQRPNDRLVRSLASRAGGISRNVGSAGNGFLITLTLAAFLAANPYQPGIWSQEQVLLHSSSAVAQTPPGKSTPSGAPAWAEQFSKELSIGSPSEKSLAPEQVESISRKARPSVVHIIAFDESGAPIGHGTGFIVGDGLVATNLHVVRDATTWSMSTSGNKPLIAPVQIKTRSKPWNLAVLETEFQAPALSMTVSEEPKSGDPVLVLGTMLDGTISNSTNRIGRERNTGGTLRYSLNTRIAPVASGGPVFDASGKLAGIATFSLIGTRFESLVTPISALRRLLPQTNSVTGQTRATVKATQKTENIRNNIALAKYEKTLHSSKEILTLQNKTKKPIHNLRFLITYKDMNGRTIRSRKLTLQGTIPANKERSGTFATPDRLRPYEYIHGNVILGENLYDIEIIPLDYDIDTH